MLNYISISIGCSCWNSEQREEDMDWNKETLDKDTLSGHTEGSERDQAVVGRRNLGRKGEDNGTPLQYSCLENPMDGGAWWAAVHGVAKSRTRLRDFTFPFHCHALEKEMATHSSVLAWRIPGTGEPGGLPSMGSHRVRHDWSDLAAGRKGGHGSYEHPCGWISVAWPVAPGKAMWRPRWWWTAALKSHQFP